MPIVLTTPRAIVICFVAYAMTALLGAALFHFVAYVGQQHDDRVVEISILWAGLCLAAWIWSTIKMAKARRGVS